MKKIISSLLLITTTQCFAFTPGEAIQYVCPGANLACVPKISSVTAFEAALPNPTYTLYTFNNVQFLNQPKFCLEPPTNITVIAGVAPADAAAANANYPNAFTCGTKLAPNDPKYPNIVGAAFCETGSPAVNMITISIGPNNPDQPLPQCST